MNEGCYFFFVLEFKGSSVKPFGDVDAVVGVSNMSQMDELAQGLAAELGGQNGERVLGAGRVRSVLTNENYQVWMENQRCTHYSAPRLIVPRLIVQLA